MSPSCRLPDSGGGGCRRPEISCCVLVTSSTLASQRVTFPAPRSCAHGVDRGAKRRADAVQGDGAEHRGSELDEGQIEEDGGPRRIWRHEPCVGSLLLGMAPESLGSFSPMLKIMATPALVLALLQCTLRRRSEMVDR